MRVNFYMQADSKLCVGVVLLDAVPAVGDEVNIFVTAGTSARGTVLSRRWQLSDSASADPNKPPPTPSVTIVLT